MKSDSICHDSRAWRLKILYLTGRATAFQILKLLNYKTIYKINIKIHLILFKHLYDKVLKLNFVKFMTGDLKILVLKK